MPKITRTFEGYKCAECGETYSDVKHWPVPELVIGGDGRDCIKKLRVHVQTQYDYEYSYSDSTLCLSCQRKLLLAYIDQLYPTNPPEPRTCETCKTTCPDPGAPCSCFTPRSPQSADVETVREARGIEIRRRCTFAPNGAPYPDGGFDIQQSESKALDYVIADRYASYDIKMSHANARRIVACVNACAGINTSQLETASPFDLAVQYKKEADSLRSALSEKTAQVERLKKERDAYKEQRYESNRDNARYLAKMLELREAAQGILDDDDKSVSLKDQQTRWIDRMDKLRDALAATATGPSPVDTFARFEKRSPVTTDAYDGGID